MNRKAWSSSESIVTCTDTLAEVERFRTSNNLRFPIGMDYDQKVAESLGATRTPEVVVLDERRAIRYQGRIDDQYLPGVVKPQATVSELVSKLGRSAGW